VNHARTFTALVAASAVGLSLSSPGHAAVTPGQRTFIDSFVSLPALVTNYLGTLLPERSAIGSAYLGEQYAPVFTVTASSKVTITFVSEGAGYQNALGYFTYAMNGDSVEIVDRQLIFPNASASGSGGSLVPGDTVTLRDADGNQRVFTAGTHIGFFLLSDGWTGSAVRGWNASAPVIPAETAAGNVAIGVASTYTGCYTTVDSINPEVTDGRPELSRHAAVLHMAGTSGFFGGAPYYVLGFEDRRRGLNSDQDFNDALFIVQGSVTTALYSPSVPIDPDNPDPDGDGVTGTDDQFPNDPLRAFNTRSPGTGLYNVAFEDMYPAIGDYDFNDAVVRFSIDTVKNASNDIKELVGTYHLVARGAAFDHAFGVGIDDVPATATGTIEIDRFSPSNAESNDAAGSIAAALRDLSGGNKSLRIENLFPSTQATLSPRGIVNTISSTPTSPPASVRVRIVFDTPVSPSQLAAAPFDPYLSVIHGASRYDIHLVGKKAFLGRPATLPTETGSSAFVDSTYHPWALLLPDGWRYPLEGVPIGGANANLRGYPSFDDWRASRGKTNLIWYNTPNTSSARTQVIDPLSNARYVRTWSIMPGFGAH
jgi:LruC domain-containing protein